MPRRAGWEKGRPKRKLAELGDPMIVAPKCASAHIRGRYKSKRLL